MIDDKLLMLMLCNYVGYSSEVLVPELRGQLAALGDCSPSAASYDWRWRRMIALRIALHLDCELLRGSPPRCEQAMRSPRLHCTIGCWIKASIFVRRSGR